MALKLSLVVDRDFAVAAVPDRLFGSFAEHLGRSIYGGLYEPGHPTATPEGFRGDVLELVRELGVTLVRYPGGNFVSNYKWEDGVGPRSKRPVRRDLAWVSLESNQFGTDEFVSWCRAAGVEPMLAVNLGTRGPSEAGDLAEYCNHPSGTPLSDMRIANVGHAEPYGVKLWCLGNEMDGDWQMGSMPAAEYGRKAREAAKMIAGRPDSTTGKPEGGLEFVACGSSNRGMPSYAAWDQGVLEECFDHVDYISVHAYVDPARTDVPGLLAFPETVGKMISEISAVCDAVAARRRSQKRTHISFDEWNVWYLSRVASDVRPWASAPPLLEDVYTLADALCVGGMLIVLLNNCDRVRIACQAQLVNVIGPIMTRTGGPAWRQTVFHPFAQAARGKVPMVTGAGKGEVPAILATFVAKPDGTAELFAVNRSLDRAVDVDLALRGFAGTSKVIEWTVLSDPDLKAVNTEHEPDRVRPRAQGGARLEGGSLKARLPPASWNVIRLRAMAAPATPTAPSPFPGVVTNVYGNWFDRSARVPRNAPPAVLPPAPSSRSRPRIPTDAAEQYRRDGAVVLRGVIPAEWIARLRGLVDAAMKTAPEAPLLRGGEAQPGFYQEQDTWRRMPEVLEWIKDGPMGEIAGKLMGSGHAAFLYDQVFVKEPGSEARTPWHQDRPYWAVKGDQVCSIWIPLDRIPKEICVEYVAGSHRWPEHNPMSFADPKEAIPGYPLPLLPDIDAAKARGEHTFLSWEMEPGDVLVFSAMAVHGSQGNAQKANRRRAWAFRFVGEDHAMAGPDPGKLWGWPVCRNLWDEGLKEGEPVTKHPDHPIVWKKEDDQAKL
ncbi:glycoside hydrolase superfamily [Hyaloraphidium curvatum]|nr:glycoside hydrolase superfamily [Hyaloraphidium curvatum]